MTNWSNSLPSRDTWHVAAQANGSPSVPTSQQSSPPSGSFLTQPITQGSVGVPTQAGTSRPGLPLSGAGHLTSPAAGFPHHLTAPVGTNLRFHPGVPNGGGFPLPYAQLASGHVGPTGTYPMFHSPGGPAVNTQSPTFAMAGHPQQQRQPPYVPNGPAVTHAPSAPLGTGLNTDWMLELLKQPGGPAQLHQQLLNLPPDQTQQALARLHQLVGQANAGPPPSHLSPSAPGSTGYGFNVTPQDDPHSNDLCIEFDASDSPEPELSAPVPSSPPSLTQPTTNQLPATEPPSASPAASVGHAYSTQLATLPATGPLPVAAHYSAVPALLDSPASETVGSPGIPMTPDAAQSDGDAGPGVKPRARIFFTPQQTLVLECIYHSTPFPAAPVRRAVTDRLGLSESQISKWLYRRRQKQKAATGVAPIAGETVDSSGPPAAYPFPVDDPTRKLVDEIWRAVAASRLPTPPAPQPVPPTALVPAPSSPASNQDGPGLPKRAKVAHPSLPGNVAHHNGESSLITSSPRVPPSPSSLVVKLRLNSSPLASPTGLNAPPATRSPVPVATTPTPVLLSPLAPPADLQQESQIEGFYRRMADTTNRDDRLSLLLTIRRAQNPVVLNGIAESKIPSLLRVWIVEAFKQYDDELLGNLLETVAHLPMTVDRLQQSKLGMLTRTICSKWSKRDPQLLQRAEAILAQWQSLATSAGRSPIVASTTPPAMTAPVDSPNSVSSTELVDDIMQALPAGEKRTFAYVEITTSSPAPSPASSGQPRTVVDSPQNESAAAPTSLTEKAKEETPSRVSSSYLDMVRRLSTGRDARPPAASDKAATLIRRRPNNSADKGVLDTLLLSMTSGRGRSTPAAATSKVEDNSAARRIAAKLADKNAKAKPPAGLTRTSPALPNTKPAGLGGEAQLTNHPASSGARADASRPYGASSSLLAPRPTAAHQKSRTGRKVTFAADDALVKVKEFYRRHPADFSTPAWVYEEPDDEDMGGYAFDVNNGPMIPHEFGNARDLDRQEGHMAFKQSRVIIQPTADWVPPTRIAFDPVGMPDTVRSVVWCGKDSTERRIEADRERKVLSVNYMSRDKIPPSPASPTLTPQAPAPGKPADLPGGTPHTIPFVEDMTPEERDGPLRILAQQRPQKTVASPVLTADSQSLGAMAGSYRAAADNTDMTAGHPGGRQEDDSTAQSLSSLMQELSSSTVATPSPIPVPATTAPTLPAATVKPSAPTAASVPGSSGADPNALLANLGSLLHNPALVLQMLTLLNGANQQQQGTSGSPAAPGTNPAMANALAAFGAPALSQQAMPTAAVNVAPPQPQPQMPAPTPAAAAMAQPTLLDNNTSAPLTNAQRASNAQAILAQLQPALASSRPAPDSNANPFLGQSAPTLPPTHHHQQQHQHHPAPYLPGPKPKRYRKNKNGGGGGGGGGDGHHPSYTGGDLMDVGNDADYMHTQHQQHHSHLARQNGLGEGNGKLSSSPQPVAKKLIQSRRRVPCKFFMGGGCRRGDNCHFSHERN